LAVVFVVKTYRIIDTLYCDEKENRGIYLKEIDNDKLEDKTMLLWLTAEQYKRLDEPTKDDVLNIEVTRIPVYNK